MLRGNDLSWFLFVGIWLRDTRICRCAIPNTSTLPPGEGGNGAVILIKTGICLSSHAKLLWRMVVEGLDFGGGGGLGPDPVEGVKVQPIIIIGARTGDVQGGVPAIVFAV